MPHRSVYSYAWDLADFGVAQAADEFRGWNINAITLAVAYHAGKFLRPHGRSGRVYFPEDGTVYFPADAGRYGEIKPVVNHLLSEQDVLDECCRLEGMRTQAWVVLLHNSLLGQRHPEACVANAFGDRYIYSLCPANPAVRSYAVTLCTEVAEKYPVEGISLETPGFLPFEHGYHHEFSLVPQDAWLNNLLGLCFCPHCTGGAETDGIDASSLQARAASAIDAWFAGEAAYPDDMAAAFWTAEIATDPELAAFFRWRCRVVESLVAEIRDAVRSDAAVAVIPSVARPTAGAWFEGSDLARLYAVADHLEVCFYEPSVERIRADLQDVIRRCGGSAKLRGILRPGPPDLTSRDEVIGAVKALLAGGIEDISFYNYGHVRRSGLEWMAAALAEADA